MIMTIRIIVTGILFLEFAFNCTGQINPDCYAKKEFLIIYSSKDYTSALKIAQNAATILDIKLDLRNLRPDSDTMRGLTFPADTCKKTSQRI